MPPLRDRVEDLTLLINDLPRRIENEDRDSVQLTGKAIHALADYGWLGNVRKLANLVERLVILYPNAEVDAKDLPEKYQMCPRLASVEGMSVGVGGTGAAAAVGSLPRDGLDLKDHLHSL